MLKHKPWIAALLLAASAATQAQVAAVGANKDATGTRWINARAVNLRTQASPGADVMARMALNTRVELIARAAGTRYCEINAPVSGGPLKGFTACEYLSLKPLDFEKALGWRDEKGQPIPDYDAAKAFNLSPTWNTLAGYVNYLEVMRLTEAERLNPPRGIYKDAELERMKAHLAQGVYGPAPAPLADWAALKRQAAAAVRGKPAADAAAVANLSQAMANRLGAHQVEFAPERPEVLLHLVNAIELPRPRPSLFADAAEIAPPQEGAVAMSGRFHIIHRWRTRPRPPATDGWAPGVWDVLNGRASLVEPVAATTLYRDGRMDNAPSFAPQTFPLRSEFQDEPMCEGYQDGFAFGDSDPSIWKYIYPDTDEARAKPTARKPGSVLQFHLRKAPPQATALVTASQQALDRQATGFVHATMLRFDLDHDGEPDLALWEGVGHGPGHMGGPTETDDAWYRLFFVNISGSWKVLGSDQFGYGCGC
jgi:hypothetical protein